MCCNNIIVASEPESDITDKYLVPQYKKTKIEQKVPFNLTKNSIYKQFNVIKLQKFNHPLPKWGMYVTCF